MALSAKKLAALDKTRRNVQKETYQAMLEQFTRKIRTSYELGRKDAILTIPPFVVGFPRYDLAKAVMYMARQLVRLGYSVTLIGPLDLRVTWAREQAAAPEEDAAYGSIDVLPGLVNLQKTAQQLRKATRK
jgi:hypothetical protein